MIATEQLLDRRTIARYAIGSLGTGGFATLPGLVVVLFGIGAGLLGDGLSDGRIRGEGTM